MKYFVKIIVLHYLLEQKTHKRVAKYFTLAICGAEY